MVQDNTIEEQQNRLSGVFLYSLSIIFQALLFFGAAAAVTLFYLTYRAADFLQVFIVVGLILIFPWFIISLLPTLFGLNDSDLKKEILGGQLLIILVIFAVLFALALSINFHPVLIDYAVSLLLNSWSYLQDILNALQSLIDQGIKAALALCNETIVPLFSHLFSG